MVDSFKSKNLRNIFCSSLDMYRSAFNFAFFDESLR